MRLPTLLLWFACLLVGSADPLTAKVRLQGRVTDAASGLGITGARVLLTDEQGRWVGVRTTDEDGGFEFRVRLHGPYRLTASRFGYIENTSPRLWLGDHEVVRVELRLDVGALLLAPLEIVARSTPSNSPVLSNFNARLRSGVTGTLLTRNDIERLKPGRVTDVLATVPGIRLENAGGAGHSRVAYLRRACPAQVFLDGFLLNRGGHSPAIDDVVAPGSVEGIEVYGGFSSVPAEFLNPDSQCGVIAIWTRRGG